MPLRKESTIPDKRPHKSTNGTWYESRACSNPEISISLSENYICGGHSIKPRMKRSASLEKICMAMSPWNDKNAYLDFKRQLEKARKSMKKEKEQSSAIPGKEEQNMAPLRRRIKIYLPL